MSHTGQTVEEEEALCQLDFQVHDYEINGEFASLDAHIFILEVWLNQEPYLLKRTYKDICEFDTRLNKKYPKTTLPPCPFSASSSFVPNQGQKEKTGGIRGSLVNLKKNARESIASRRHSLNDMDPDEMISKKKPALQAYLKSLYEIPEIVRSTNFIDFLDPASAHGDSYENTDISLTEMLLEGSPEKSVNIVKKHSVNTEVSAGQYIVWKFITKKRDIGFSIDIGDTNVLTYQRYNCHERSIQNVLKAPIEGTATLIWDNTYSKLRTKFLTYRFKVLSGDEYKELSKKCMDLSREQQINNSRRSFLKKELTLKCHQILSTTSGRMISNDFTVDMPSGEKAVHEDLQQKVAQLQNEKKSLQMALSESEIALADVRQELEVLNKKLEKGETIRHQLDRVSSERDELQQEVLDESVAKKKLEIDLQTALDELKSNRDFMEKKISEVEAVSHSHATLQHQHALLAEENAKLVEEIQQLKSSDRPGADTMLQIQRLKGEKKQLKAYALGLKSQLEDVDRQKKSQAPDSELKVAIGLVNKMTPLLATLDLHLNEIQSLKNEYITMLGLGGSTKDEIVQKTNNIVESGMNTSDNVSLMLDYAGMKLTAISNNSGSEEDAGGDPSTPNVPDHCGSIYAPIVSNSPQLSPANSPPRPKSHDHPST